MKPNEKRRGELKPIAITTERGGIARSWGKKLFRVFLFPFPPLLLSYTWGGGATTYTYGIRKKNEELEREKVASDPWRG